MMTHSTEWRISESVW